MCWKWICIIVSKRRLIYFYTILFCLIILTYCFGSFGQGIRVSSWNYQKNLKAYVCNFTGISKYSSTFIKSRLKYLILYRISASFLISNTIQIFTFPSLLFGCGSCSPQYCLPGFTVILQSRFFLTTKYWHWGWRALLKSFFAFIADIFMVLYLFTSSSSSFNFVFVYTDIWLG